MKRSRATIDWTDIRRRLDCNQRALEGSLVVDRARLEDAFHQRAVKLARRQSTDLTIAKTAPLLVFSLSTEHYGIELEHIVGTFASPSCTPVPGGPSYLLGVANFDGEIRSVLDPRPLVGLPGADVRVGDTSYVILIRCGGTPLGLCVDAIERVSHVVLDQLAMLEDSRSGTKTTLFRGVTDDHVIVLDVRALAALIASRPLNSA